MKHLLKRGARSAELGATSLPVRRRITTASHLRLSLSPLLPLFLLLAPGCGWLDRPGSLFGDRNGPTGPAATAEMGETPVDAAQLVGDNWVMAAPDPRLATDPSLPRWRHPALESLYARAPADRPNLIPALTLPDAPLRANAAIGLARWGDGRGLGVLVETVEHAQLKLPLRQAAAEAIGNITQPSPVAALRTLLDNWGRYEPSRALAYSPELHADLLRALSRHVDAADDPRFTESLRAPTLGPRQEAINAWSRTKATELPTAVVDLRADPQPQLRAAAVVLTLDRRHPQALEFARNAIQDYETDVRTATIAALGRYGGPEATAMLERVMLHEGEVLRAAAVPALHQLGVFTAVQTAAGDKAARVRKAAVACLAQHPDRVGTGLVLTLLLDDSPEVRKATLAVLEAWPLPAAGPVLLSAMGEPIYETRKLAGEQLARRWPPAQGFSADVPPDRRGEVVAEIERRWSAEFGNIDREALAAAVKPNPGAPSSGNPGDVVQVGYNAPLAPAAPQLSEDRLNLLQKMVEEAARNEAAAVSFDGFGADVVQGLERLVVERGVVLPDAVFKKVLPPKDEVFAALEQLTWDDVHERRRAANRLSAAAEPAPLRPLAVARLVELGLKESDGLVWSGLFAALARDSSEQAAALAYGGLSHLSPEVRRMSCEHLGRAPHPRYTQALVAALADPHVSVAIEATRALGHSGMLTDPAPVERMLTSADPGTRLAAAETLHKNGLPSGAAAYERIAHDHDPEVRRRAATAVGNTGDATFVPLLVGLLDDTTSVKKAAIDGLIKLVGKDVSVRAGEPLPPLNDRAKTWQAWHAGKLPR